MEVKAKVSYVRMSPYRGRIVADAIRGKGVSEAMGLLTFTPKKAAVVIRKLLNSAISNATARGGVNIDDLYVKSIFVDGGPTMKRVLLRSMGRANRVMKRSSHVTIVLDEK